MRPFVALTLVLLLLVACGSVEPTPPPSCGTDAGIVDVVTDTITDATSPDTSTGCTLVCDPLVGWVCGGRILGCADGGQCCDPQAPGCGCLGHLGYVCNGVPSDDALSCAKCGERCQSSPDAGSGEQ